MKKSRIFHQAASNERHNNNQHNIFGLDEDDIDRIQEILDESDDDGDVEILSDNGNEFPKPIKPPHKNVN